MSTSTPQIKGPRPRRDRYKCHWCGEINDTVQVRYCAEDLARDGMQVNEIICDDCEAVHEAAALKYEAEQFNAEETNQ